MIARVVASKEQKGFGLGRGVDDMLQASGGVSEEVRTKKGTGRVVISLYDIEKAYPRVCRWALWRLLERWGVPPEMIGILLALHDFTEVEVIIYGGHLAVTNRIADSGKDVRRLFHYLTHSTRRSLADFRRRRRDKVQETGLLPGLDRTIKVDGKLRRPHQERNLKQPVIIQHQDKHVTGDI